MLSGFEAAKRRKAHELGEAYTPEGRRVGSCHMMILGCLRSVQRQLATSSAGLTVLSQVDEMSDFITDRLEQVFESVKDLEMKL